MTKLTPRQEAFLAYADEADNRYRSAKVNARKRAQEMVEQEIAQFSAARDKAVWDAIESGIPKRQVGLIALKTTSPNTVAEIYNRVLNAQEFVDVELASKAGEMLYTWSPKHVMPNGYKYWFLLVDGDNYHVDEGEGEWRVVGDGYPYVDFGLGNWSWTLGKPSVEAQEWAEKNRPSQ